jgi:ABC transporter substrate binding protein (PQQ-dependent alcohol dehydrogenase system)
LLKRWKYLFVLPFFFGIVSDFLSCPGYAQTPLDVNITYIWQPQKRVLPQSFLDQPPDDEGVQGAQLAIADNNTTGQFTGQNFHLDVVALAADQTAAAKQVQGLIDRGARLFVADLPSAATDQIADLAAKSGAIVINATNPADALRAEGCRTNLLHTYPSRAMLADGLMQYLLLKRWSNILLVTGQGADDQAFGEALRRSARKFGLTLVADLPWTFDPGARRTDTGHVGIAAEVARFTQPYDYDVLVVADEGNNFGDELSFRQTEARPVAGTQGVVATPWARPFEQWGATQLQSRFIAQAKRWMTPHDYGAWMAVRTLGEAVGDVGNADPKQLLGFIRGADFELDAFKGVRETFRDWDGQLRQPILLADDRALVTVSPQPGFLHEFSELDTLGIDRPETKCQLK